MQYPELVVCTLYKLPRGGFISYGDIFSPDQNLTGETMSPRVAIFARKELIQGRGNRLRNTRSIGIRF